MIWFNSSADIDEPFRGTHKYEDCWKCKYYSILPQRINVRGFTFAYDCSFNNENHLPNILNVVCVGDAPNLN